jgi:hypothetical protein
VIELRMGELNEYFKQLLFNAPEVLGMAPVDRFFSLQARLTQIGRQKAALNGAVSNGAAPPAAPAAPAAGVMGGGGLFGAGGAAPDTGVQAQIEAQANLFQAQQGAAMAEAQQAQQQQAQPTAFDAADPLGGASLFGGS